MDSGVGCAPSQYLRGAGPIFLYPVLRGPACDVEPNVATQEPKCAHCNKQAPLRRRPRKNAHLAPPCLRTASQRRLTNATKKNGSKKKQKKTPGGEKARIFRERTQFFPSRGFELPLPRNAQKRPLAYGVVFLRLSGGLGCFSPAIGLDT
jgi:hypothetical protein